MQYKWPVMGHQKELAEFEKDLKQNRLSHAYLLAGPSKIGKRLIACTFAQLLQCTNNFCRDCPTCHQIEKGQHIDTLELKDEGESLKIGEIRELISHLSTTTSSHYKIVIIQNIERITPEAANAFLKNLEEPIPGIMFLMTTRHPKNLLDTILSRSRLITFHPLSESTIRAHLSETQNQLDAKTIDMMAAFSMGKPGRAMEFLNDPDQFRFYQDIYHEITKFFERSSLTDRMLYVETLAKEPQTVQIFFELFLHVVRGFLLQKLRNEQIPYSFEQLFAMIEHLNRARYDLDHNLNSRMVLESLMMTF